MREPCVLFKTPGLLDLRSVTHFGINAKPNSTSPIGFFGTGLKYAIAVCLRHGLKVTIWVGREAYVFSTESEEFRGKPFGMIYMRQTAPKRLFKNEVEMSYTTELGKTWELWQAFRELHSNTIDEGGETTLSGEFSTKDFLLDRETHTHIFVQGADFVEEFHNMDKIFLPQASRDRTDVAVEHFEGSSNHIYYRGMRVQDLDKPSLYTYNILSKIDLTEDRTAKYSTSVEQVIREHIISEASIPMIRAILKAPEGTYEQRLDFSSWHYVTPSRHFIDTGREMRRVSTNSTLATYIERHDEQELEPEPLTAPFLPHLIQAFKSDDADLIRRLNREYSEAIVEELEYYNSLPVKYLDSFKDLIAHLDLRTFEDLHAGDISADSFNQPN